MVQKKQFCKICKAEGEEKLSQCKRCGTTLCNEHGEKDNHDCYYSAPQKEIKDLEFEGEEFTTTFDDTAVIERLAKQTYPSEESGLRELIVNAQGHGCRVAIEAGYKTVGGETPYVSVYLDPLDRKLVVHDIGGMGMSKKLIRKVLSCVGKSGNFNSSMAGQFGMGFYAVLKLASVVIVETWSRETDERQALIFRDGKYWKEIKQDPADQLEEYGTKLTMTLYPEPEDANRTQKDRIADINKLLESDDLTNNDEMTLNTELKLLQNEPDSVIQKNIMNSIRSISEHSGIKTEIILEHDLEGSYSEGIQVIEPITAEEFIKVTNDEVIKDEYGVIENEDYSLHFAMAQTKNDYTTSGASGIRHLLVGVPIVTKITLPRFTRYILNIKNERKFSPVASREELLKSSTTRLQSIIDKDLEEFFGEISVNNVEDYRKAKYQLPVKYPNKIMVTDKLPMHTMRFYDLLQTVCQELSRSGDRTESKLQYFIDNWEHTILAKSNSKPQRNKVFLLDDRNRIIIFSRKFSSCYENEELVQKHGIPLAKDYLKANKHLIPKGSRAKSAYFETAAHSGDEVEWMDIDDIANTSEMIVYCDEGFKEIMRTYMPGVWWIKDSKRLHAEIKEHNDDELFDEKSGDTKITSDQVMSFDDYIDFLKNKEIDSSVGKMSLYKALTMTSGNDVNYFSGNLNEVAHANKKYVKLDGLVLFIDQTVLREMNFVVNWSYLHTQGRGKLGYARLVEYSPMDKIIKNILDDILDGFPESVKHSTKVMLSSVHASRIEDIIRLSERVGKFNNLFMQSIISDVYSYTTNYSESDRANDLRREKLYFDGMEKIFIDFEIKSNKYDQWLDWQKVIKEVTVRLMPKNEEFNNNLFGRILEKLHKLSKDVRESFTRQDKLRMLKAELPVDKVKTYMTKLSSESRHESFVVEMVFNEKLAKVNNKMINDINRIVGVSRFLSFKKVNKRIKLVLYN
jgi:hypothetical protein